MNRVLAVLLLLPLLMLADPSAAQTAPRFRITVIDVPGNAVEGWRTAAINDNGVVASQVEVPKAGGQGRRRVLFRWTPGGAAELMPAGRNGRFTTALAGIDGHGTVVGTVYKPSRLPRVVSWDRTGQLHDVARFDTTVEYRAHGVNADGDVIGYELEEWSLVWRQAMFWPLGGEPVNLGAFTTQTLWASAVNRADQVVGTRYGTEPMRGFIWSPDGGFRLFGPLPGSDASGYLAFWSINDQGTVVGYGALGAEQPAQIFRWTAADGFEIIPQPQGFELLTPLEINALGWIIGNGRVPGTGMRPYLWTPENGAYFVADLIDSADPLREQILLQSVSGINAGGVLAGVGALDGRKVPVVLTPVTLP